MSANAQRLTHKQIHAYVRVHGFRSWTTDDAQISIAVVGTKDGLLCDVIDTCAPTLSAVRLTLGYKE